MAGGVASQGTCAHWADQGEPCGAVDGPESVDCAWAVCVLANPADQVGTCRRLQGLGGACDHDEECLSRHCDPQTSACVGPTCP
jgi:hypothetical protein